MYLGSFTLPLLSTELYEYLQLDGKTYRQNIAGSKIFYAKHIGYVVQFYYVRSIITDFTINFNSNTGEYNALILKNNPF